MSESSFFPGTGHLLSYTASRNARHPIREVSRWTGAADGLIQPAAVARVTFASLTFISESYSSLPPATHASAHSGRELYSENLLMTCGFKQGSRAGCYSVILLYYYYYSIISKYAGLLAVCAAKQSSAFDFSAPLVAVAQPHRLEIMRNSFLRQDISAFHDPL